MPEKLDTNGQVENAAEQIILEVIAAALGTTTTDDDVEMIELFEGDVIMNADAFIAFLRSGGYTVLSDDNSLTITKEH